MQDETYQKYGIERKCNRVSYNNSTLNQEIHSLKRSMNGFKYSNSKSRIPKL